MSELPGCYKCNAETDCEDCDLQDGCTHNEMGCQNASCPFVLQCRSKVKENYYWRRDKVEEVPYNQLIDRSVATNPKDTDRGKITINNMGYRHDTKNTEVPKTDFDSIPDSGKREDFETGSRRDTPIGKGRPDLLCIFALRREMRHYENGAVKYAERNWELGQPSSRYWASAFRHMLDYLEGCREEDHLSAVRWNIAGIIYNEEMVARGYYDPSILDTPDYMSIDGWLATVKNPALEENEYRKVEKDNEETIPEGEGSNRKPRSLS